KLLQVVGGKVIAGDQNQGFIGEERPPRGIRYRVVKRHPVEPPALGEGAPVFDYEMVAIRCCLGHPAFTHPTTPHPDLFQHNGLPKVAANPISDDPSYGVSRTAG